MIISNNEKKGIWEYVSSIYTLKNSQELGIEGNFLNLIKGIYEQPHS